MLDDLFKICLDPYYKPEHVNEPERENLFEIIYSPGNTMNSKEKINQRRDFNWNDLYISPEVNEEFQKQRFKQQKKETYRNRNPRVNNKSLTKKVSKRRSVTVRDDSYALRNYSKEAVQMYSIYNLNNQSQQNYSQLKI